MLVGLNCQHFLPCDALVIVLLLWLILYRICTICLLKDLRDL